MIVRGGIVLLTLITGIHGYVSQKNNKNISLGNIMFFLLFVNSSRRFSKPNYIEY